MKSTADVTMFQRSTYIMSTKNRWEVIMKGAYWEDTPPVDVVDRINAAFSHRMATGLKQQGMKYIVDLENKLIAEGKIKLKNDSPIESFTETGIKFANGSELLRTSLGDPVDHICRVWGDEVASRCKAIWGLNDECELNGVWRDLGVPGLWMMLGNLALCRFHSTHIALQTKAMEEGIFRMRYEA
ncbi:hypothetical protein GALMADRAFT_231787 [Galerina marginata CBS 339.88]|uniref:Uncharacterized protein n=1 Tax=Galerina marginata (strain CBS 339.88) TaxID=685588 RepID=A0A067SD43_GALM3|nr:hypothetical protein GALMADRAFT_231787 [Galerina marginata CBS 339.88]